MSSHLEVTGQPRGPRSQSGLWPWGHTALLTENKAGADERPSVPRGGNDQRSEHPHPRRGSPVGIEKVLEAKGSIKLLLGREGIYSEDRAQLYGHCPIGLAIGRLVSNSGKHPSVPLWSERSD